MKKVTIILVMILANISLVFAQNKKLVLTVDDAKSYALQYNRTLIKSGLSIKAAQAQLWQTIAQGLPQVEGNVSYSNPLGYKVDFGGMSIESGASSNAVITASQLLFSGNYWVGVEMSKLAKRITETQLVRNELTVKRDVAVSFYSILMINEAISIVDKNLANINDIYKKTETMVKVGVAEETDADQLSVQLMTMEVTLKSLKIQEELAYNMLRLQLGEPVTTEIDLVGNLDDASKAVNLDELFEQALVLDKNPNYQLIKQQVELNEKQVTMQKWNFAPTIAGYYNYTYKILVPGLDFNPTHTVGLTAKVPIFSSFDRKNKVTEAKINLKSAQVNAEDITDQLTIQERQLRFNLQTAYDQYTTQQKNVAVSRKVFTSMKTKFEQGVISGLDLTVANGNYLQAENSYLSTKMDLLKAQLALLELLGTL